MMENLEGLEYIVNNTEIYEIEVEVLNAAKINYKAPEELSNNLQKVTKIILCGLQKTNFPCSYKEQKQVLQALIQQEAMLKGEHAALEEQWLAQQAALEAIEDAED